VDPDQVAWWNTAADIRLALEVLLALSREIALDDE